MRSSVARLLAEPVAGCREVRAQRLDVAGPVVGLAEAVDEERHLVQTETGVELPGERDDLDVEVRVVGAEHLDADLVELAVPAPLGLLVAEVRAGVPDLPRHRRAVLGKGPAHARGQLGPQRDVAAALVDEVVHLLGDHVGGITDAGEHTEVLEQRRDDLPVAGALDHVGEHVDEPTPTAALGRQDVAHAGTGLERWHGRSGYRRGCARDQAVGVVDRVDALDRAEHRVEVPGFANSNSKRIFATRSVPVTV